MKEVYFILNGQRVNAEINPEDRLIDILRNKFMLTGAKESCGQGECGACTVLMDNEAVNACLVFANQLDGHSITTIEGLGCNGKPDPLQEAFIDCGAIQCGYCTPGMIMSAKGLLIKNPHPNQSEIKDALEGNICRCTGYVKIIEAVLKASEVASEGRACNADK